MVEAEFFGRDRPRVGFRDSHGEIRGLTVEEYINRLGQDLGNVRTASAGLSRRSVTITSHQPDQDPSIVAPEAPRHSKVESEAPILCLVRRGPTGSMWSIADAPKRRRQAEAPARAPRGPSGSS